MENTAVLFILALIGFVFAAVILGIIQTKKERTQRVDDALNEVSKEPEYPPKEIPEITSQTTPLESPPPMNSDGWVDMDIFLSQNWITVSRFSTLTEGLYRAIEKALKPIMDNHPDFKNPSVFMDGISSVGELESISKAVDQCLTEGIGSSNTLIPRNNEYEHVRRTCFTPGGIAQVKLVNLVRKESSTKFKTYGYTRQAADLKGKELGVIPNSVDVNLCGDSNFSGKMRFSDSPRSMFGTAKKILDNKLIHLHEAEVEIKIDVLQSSDWTPCAFIPVPAIGPSALSSLQELYAGDAQPVVETYFSEGCFVIQARLGKEVVLISDRSTMTVLQAVDPFFFNNRQNVVIENSLLTHLLNDTSNHQPKVYDFVTAKINLKEDEALNIRWFHNQ